MEITRIAFRRWYLSRSASRALEWTKSVLFGVNYRMLQSVWFRFGTRLRSASSIGRSLNTSPITGFSWAILSVGAISMPFAADKGKLDVLKKVVSDADSLYDTVQYEQLYSFLVQHKDKRSDEVKWRLARATYEMSRSARSRDEKVQLLKEAKGYVYEALDINPDNFAAHKWAAILVVELAEQEGTKAKIQQSLVSKEHMLKAHALNPKDGTTLYLLGVWCFSFAELTWSQRKLAAVIFATPPESTFEEALGFFLKAESGEPNFYSMNLLMLGKTYLKMDDKENAVSFLRRARDYPLKTAEDKQATEEASKLLKSLGAH